MRENLPLATRWRRSLLAVCGALAAIGIVVVIAVLLLRGPQLRADSPSAHNPAASSASSSPSPAVSGSGNDPAANGADPSVENSPKSGDKQATVPVVNREGKTFSLGFPITFPTPDSSVDNLDKNAAGDPVMPFQVTMDKAFYVDIPARTLSDDPAYQYLDRDARYLRLAARIDMLNSADLAPFLPPTIFNAFAVTDGGDVIRAHWIIWEPILDTSDPVFWHNVPVNIVFEVPAGKTVTQVGIAPIDGWAAGAAWIDVGELLSEPPPAQ
ncbi:hypothetical protein [Trueperella sp. LYQ141]|uniref:hypothetical protein n=1 Tax=Trueperella sp. LYQ141 TaxID=3391058 RepID=UPI003982E5A4